jgi:phosphate transport system substrate-binding protein
MRSRLFAALAVSTIFVINNAHAAELNGAGGTAIYPVLSKWADRYAKEGGDTVIYQPIGSGGGIKQIESNSVLFANTDMPLKPEEVDTQKLVQFPLVIISITPVVHLAGIAPGELLLDGSTLADIYLGKITQWDDPALKKLNPTITLPHQTITTVHRSDASGTTFNFTNYLSKVSREWKNSVGEGTVVSWPNGVEGRGNAGVASHVQETDGAIGYVEYAFVVENHLTYTNMMNDAGKKIEPKMDAFLAAAADADFTSEKSFYRILTNQPGDKSWPITAATYILLRKDNPADQNHSVLQFLDWVLKKGQPEATALDYVSLPENVVAQIEKHWSKELPDAWKAPTN